MQQQDDHKARDPWARGRSDFRSQRFEDTAPAGWESSQNSTFAQPSRRAPQAAPRRRPAVGAKLAGAGLLLAACAVSALALALRR